MLRTSSGMAAALLMILPQPAVAQNLTIHQATLGETNQKTSEVSTAEVRRILADGSAIVLDSRKRSEYVISHIPGARNAAPRPGAPASEFVEEVLRIAGGNKASALVLYCNGEYCQASRRLADQLVGAGFTNVRRYQLGIAVWRALGGVTEMELEGVMRVLNIDRTAVFVDARAPAEFAKGSLAGARNIPADTKKFEGTDLLPGDDFNTRIVVFGRDATEARTLAETIVRSGARQNVSYFPGGFTQLMRGTK